VTITNDNEQLRLCSFLSSIVYDVYDLHKEHKSRNDCLIRGVQTCLRATDKSGIWEHNKYALGLFERTFAVWCSLNKVLYIAFKGSSSLADWLTNIGASPSIGTWWVELHPNIEVHSGIAKRSEDFLRTYVPKITQIIKRTKARLLVLTGHSLGGAVAQVVKLMLHGQAKSGFAAMGEKNWKCRTEWTETFKRSSLKIFVNTFASPMVFSFPKVNRKSEQYRQDLITRLQDDISNYVYNMDLVPRLPSAVDFAEKALEHIAKKAVNSEVDSYDIIRIFFGNSIKQRTGDYISSNFRKYATIVKQSGAIGNYQHIGVIKYLQGGSTKIKELDGIDFLNMGFETTDNIIDEHSVFPLCFCDKLQKNRRDQYYKNMKSAGAQIEIERR